MTKYKQVVETKLSESVSYTPKPHDRGRYDDHVRRKLRAERQEEANNQKAGNITNNVNDVTPEGRLSLGPKLADDDPQRLKRQEAWWPPMVLNRARDKDDKPKLSDDAYRAAVEMEKRWSEYREAMYKISKMDHSQGGSVQENYAKQTDLNRKHHEWVLEAMRHPYLTKRLKTGRSYYSAFRQMVFDGVPIKSMRKANDAHDSTLEKIVVTGCELYVKLHFEGKR